MDKEVEIVWRAYELRPDPVPTLDPRGAYLERVWNSSIYPLAESLGMRMQLPPVQPRSRLAHEAAKWAEAEQNRFNIYNAEIFRAFFERGEDIGEIDVLVRLADDAGLAGGLLRRALDERRYEQDVLADEEKAGELGVSGVPAFVAKRRAALVGMQSAANLLALTERVRPSTI